MDLNCLLCRGVISFTITDHSCYEEHLTVDHKILFYIPWIIQKTIQEENETQEKQDVDIIDKTFQNENKKLEHQDIIFKTLVQEENQYLASSEEETSIVGSSIKMEWDLNLYDDKIPNIHAADLDDDSINNINSADLNDDPMLKTESDNLTGCDFDKGYLEAEMQTSIGEVETISLPSIKKELALDNESCDDAVAVGDNYKTKIDPCCESATVNHEDNSGAVLMSEKDPISIGDQQIDYSESEVQQIQDINLEVTLPMKNLTDMSTIELLDMYKVNNFQTPSKGQQLNFRKERLISMLKSKLVDSVTGRLTDDGVRDGLNLLRDNKIIAIKGGKGKRNLGLLRNVLKQKCPFWVQILRDMLNDENAICDPANLKAATLFKRSRGGEKLVCNLCPGINGLGRTFLNSSAMRSHMETHLSLKDRKTFECQLCKTTYVLKISLEKHALSCNGFSAPFTRTFSCKLCPEMFCKRSELRKHELVHQQNDGKLEVCGECGQTFKCLQDWHNHIKQCVMRKGKADFKIDENVQEVAYEKG